MKPEPLKNKRMDLFYKTNECDNCVTHPKGDFCRVIAIKSAVEWLKAELKENMIYLHRGDKTYLFKQIDKAFEDVISHQ